MPSGRKNNIKNEILTFAYNDVRNFILDGMNKICKGDEDNELYYSEIMIDVFDKVLIGWSLEKKLDKNNIQDEATIARVISFYEDRLRAEISMSSMKGSMPLNIFFYLIMNKNRVKIVFNNSIQ